MISMNWRRMDFSMSGYGNASVHILSWKYKWMLFTRKRRKITLFP